MRFVISMLLLIGCSQYLLAQAQPKLKLNSKRLNYYLHVTPSSFSVCSCSSPKFDEIALIRVILRGATYDLPKKNSFSYMLPGGVKYVYNNFLFFGKKKKWEIIESDFLTLPASFNRVPAKYDGKPLAFIEIGKFIPKFFIENPATEQALNLL